MYKRPLADLKTGDLISVAYGNRAHLCIFKDYGRADNAKFYMVDYIKSRIKYQEVRVEKDPSHKVKIFVDYIASDADYRVFPVDEYKLTEDRQKEVYEVKQLLKKYDLI